jgi:type IV secretory pathway VirD2 relaxase
VLVNCYGRHSPLCQHTPSYEEVAQIEHVKLRLTAKQMDKRREKEMTNNFSHSISCTDVAVGCMNQRTKHGSWV